MKRMLKITSALLITVFLASLTGCAGCRIIEDLPDGTLTAGESEIEEETGSADTYLSDALETQAETTAAEALTTASETTAAEEETTAAPILQNVKQLAFESLGNGTCRVSGVGDCTDACVVIPERSPDGDVVIGIADQAFYECASVVAIQIPSSVAVIGDRAFGLCPNLVYISVASGNLMFRDSAGVLYSADGSKLIAYPSGSPASEFSISKNVTSISSMAFCNCKQLKTINFGGTQEQWAAIAIGAYNYSLNTASIYCVDTLK